MRQSPVSIFEVLLMAHIPTSPNKANTLPSSGYKDYRSVRYFANLDGLRFVCIFMVLWHHAIPVEWPGLQLDERGFLGVDFFFVLSGYLITTLLLREIDRDGSFSLRNFYIRRVIRIIPVYFFVVFVVAFYYIIVKGEDRYLELLPYYFLFLSNFLVDDIPTLGPTWSLSVEEQYYLIWPLLLMMLSPRWIIPVLSLLIVGNVLVMTGWVWTPEPIAAGPLLIRMPNATYAPILMGSLAAVMLHKKWFFDLIWPMVSHPLASILGVVTLCLMMEFFPKDLLGLPNFAIHSLMTFVLITLVVQARTPFSPFLTNPVVVRIGAISYGIYLYHLLALDITSRALGAFGISQPWLVLVLYSMVSCLIAEISFRTLEAYFRKFKPH